MRLKHPYALDPPAYAIKHCRKKDLLGRRRSKKQSEVTQKTLIRPLQATSPGSVRISTK